LLPLLGLAVAVALVAPALGLGGDDGRKVTDAVAARSGQRALHRRANAIRGVPGGGLPWEIDGARADLRADGRLHVEVEGLVLARRAPVPSNFQGTNPIAQFKAIVSCLTIPPARRRRPTSRPLSSRRARVGTQRSTQSSTCRRPASGRSSS
jgi:hypothetical protein